MSDAGADTTETGWFTPVAANVNPVDLNIGVPHPARMYDYYLGGKENFPADRETAEQAIAAFPNTRNAARQNRAFLVRAVRHLVGEVGIRQFLDIGTGIPTSPNLHEVAQGIAPDTRVVYADNDPIVLAHARALLTSTSQGRTAYLDADIRDPERILASAELRGTLDLTRPVALSLIAIFHFIDDADDPYGLVRRLVDALPSGSYLALTNATGDHDPTFEPAAETYRRRGVTMRLRTRAEVERFFDGLELVDPGVQVVHRWRPDPTTEDLTDAQVSVYGAIARKP
ncbi:SAM-dependent methyltransferase [Frankia sp. AiPs1]|uniref:SAM-dependent methyltransferase n=1 Tax=Frankia sp. AiPs1 TaxID=573493 RepID=UPI002044AA5E|nr:SAM-dependent methyltransferase [Frankia sp. AiPs1]MCM3923846.1 SAM-dependent methyltransferase [Frankia sp. AiPs1]